MGRIGGGGMLQCLTSTFARHVLLVFLYSRVFYPCSLNFSFFIVGFAEDVGQWGKHLSECSQFPASLLIDRASILTNNKISLKMGQQKSEGIPWIMMGVFVVPTTISLYG